MKPDPTTLGYDIYFKLGDSERVRLRTYSAVSWDDAAKEMARRLAAAQELVEWHRKFKYGPLDGCIPCRMNIKRAEQAEAKLAAAQSCPEGWVCVPEEPTKEMMRAFWLKGPYPANPFTLGYKAMLASRPKEKEE